MNRHRPTVQNEDKNVFKYFLVVKHRKCDELHLAADFIHPLGVHLHQVQIARLVGRSYLH